MNPTRLFFLVKISKTLQNEKRRMIDTGKSGYLGIKYSEKTSEDEKGVRVLFVDEQSPAFKAGFKANDVITAINGEPVNTYEELVTKVSRHAPDTSIQISYLNTLLINEISTKDVVLGTFKLGLQRGDDQIDMRHNLQFGEIVGKGSETEKQFPEAQIGDFLIFHHMVEYKERPAGDKNYNDWHLLGHVDDTDERYELRVVHVEKEVFGVFKPGLPVEDAIIPFPSHIFCHSNLRKSALQLKKFKTLDGADAGIWLHDSWEESMEDLTQKLEQLEFQIQEMNTNTIMKQLDDEETYKQKGFIKQAIDSINRERRTITKKMHQKKLYDITVLYINPKTIDLLGVDVERFDKLMVDYGMLYPLDMFGVHYVLARVGFIEAVIKQTEI